MKKIIFSIFLFSSFIMTPHAENIKTYVDYLKYNDRALSTSDWFYVEYGNRDISFSVTYDNALTDKWLYNSLVLCSDTTYSGGIIPSAYNGYIKDIQYNHTQYSCSYPNSTYDEGKVVIINFKTYNGDGEFSGYFTTYQDDGASMLLIDYVVNDNSFVSAKNYADETAITQNSTIINQNTTIIDQNSQIINGQNNIHDRVEEGNQKLDDLNDNLTNDSIDTNKSNSFFNNFNDEDNGGISGVVTAPLRFIRKMSNTCTPLTMDVLGADVQLPCGDTLFWGREDVQTFRTFWNSLVGGFLSYLILRKLFKVIDNLKNPDNSKVELMDL